MNILFVYVCLAHISQSLNTLMCLHPGFFKCTLLLQLLSEKKSASTSAEIQTSQAIPVCTEKKKPSEPEKENGLCLDAFVWGGFIAASSWSGVSGCHTSYSLKMVTTSFLLYFSTFSICSCLLPSKKVVNVSTMVFHCFLLPPLK